MSAYKTNVTVSKEDKFITINSVSVNITDKTLIELFNNTNVIDGWKFIHWDLEDADEDTFLGDIESEVNREYKNTQFNKDEYSKYVEPFIGIWEKQKAIDEFVPEKTLEEVKADKIIDLDNDVSTAILAGFKYEVLDEEGNLIQGTSRYYSYDTTDQSNFSDTNIMINNALILGQQDALPLIDWNSYVKPGDKSTLVREKISYADFIALNTFACFNHKLAVLSKAGTLKEKVQAAKTVEEVNNIKL